MELVECLMKDSKDNLNGTLNEYWKKNCILWLFNCSYDNGILIISMVLILSNKLNYFWKTPISHIIYSSHLIC